VVAALLIDSVTN